MTGIICAMESELQAVLEHMIEEKHDRSDRYASTTGCWMAKRPLPA